jgi:two-component system, sensor histidine kinase and response regulator
MKLIFALSIFIVSQIGFDTINRNVIKEASKDNHDTVNKNHKDSPNTQSPYLRGHAYKDTIRINRLNRLAENYFESNPDSTLYYGQKSIELSRKINYQAGLAIGLLQLGHANYFKGKFAQARHELDEAISLFKQLNDKKGLSNCYEVYGRMYTLLANHKLALAYLNLSLNIKKQQKDKTDIADCYKYIGMVYFNKGKLNTALEFYYKALFFDIKNHNKPGTADIYNNIGDALQNMELYPKAIEFYNKALKLSLEGNDLLGVGTSYENIGEVLLAEKNYDAAITYLSKSIAIATKQDDKDGISYISADLGLCYAQKNQFKTAINYLNTALQIAGKYNILYDKAYSLISFANVYNLEKEYNNAYKSCIQGQQLAIKLGNIWFRTKVALELNKALTGLGNFKEANLQLWQYINLKDSLKNSESVQKLTSYNLSFNFAAKQFQFEQNQHEKDILSQQQIKQQRLNVIFISVIFVMVFIAVVYYRQKRKQLKINSNLAEKNQEVLHQKNNLDNKTQELNELNNLKDRLISILAHDLRAPLCTLRGIFDLLQDESISLNEVLDMIPSVLKKLEYTSDFLDTLLSWINSQMENFESSVKSFSIKEIAVHETEIYSEQAALKGIKLVQTVPDNSFAFADPDSIRIVIRNLVTNALKFSRQNDTIEISARLHIDQYRDEQYYLVSVKDTGMGMSDEQLKKLFKGKVSSGTGTNNESGTGLGMMFCKELIEKCHGKIWVTSQENRGTQFYFTIPVETSKETSLEFVSI